MGLCVEECADANQAKEKIKEGKYDLILADIWLNDQNGMELLSQLRRQGIQTPALAITGDERKETGEQALAVGFSGVLQKPTSRQDLEASLAPLMPEAPLPQAPTASVLVSALWNDSTMRPYITRFVQELHHMVSNIDESLITDGLKPSGKVYTRCLQIAADAGAYGYPAIVSIAKTICQLIDYEAELGEVQQQVKDLRRKVESAMAGV
jgi:CheY-like chemotaxis protein